MTPYDTLSCPGRPSRYTEMAYSGHAHTNLIEVVHTNQLCASLALAVFVFLASLLDNHICHGQEHREQGNDMFHVLLIFPENI